MTTPSVAESKATGHASPARREDRTSSSAGHALQLKRSLVGQSYDQQVQMLTPHAGDGQVVQRKVSGEDEGCASQQNAPAAEAATPSGNPVGAAPAEVPDDETRAKALFDKGQVAYSEGRFMVAHDLFVQSYSLTPRSGLVFSRAQCLRQAGGHRDEAIALYEEYIASGGSRSADAEAAIAELRGPIATGDLEGDEGASKGLFDKGQAAYVVGRFMFAADLFQQAFDLSHRPGLVFSRAQALKRAGGHREEAIAAYNAYLANPGSGSRVAEANAAIIEMQPPEKSGDEETDTKTGHSVFDKGEAAYKAGQYMVAADFFEQAYAVSPRNGLLYSRAQALRMAGGHAALAIDLYQRYIDGGGERSELAAGFIAELEQPRPQGQAAA